MRRKVLLADDSLSIQKMFGLYLEKCEIDVVALSNGETAVSKLPTVQPDLILADVFMPGRTGYEVCEYVKQHPDFKHIPVLLLTGKFEPYDEKEAKRVKADGHIVKPIAEQEFVALVRKMLERAAPKPAVSQGVSQPAPAPSVAQTQAFGSFAPPPVAPASKEPSALGGQLPRFHFGGLDPNAEIPPPTIKVTPSMLDDGRLPDLEPLLPLDAAPSPPPSQDTGDFILDLPPPEQAPPVLTYPEPPKTLSTPIPRPTLSPLPKPDIGATTTKLDPAELPELLTNVAAPAPAAPPVAAEAESPLELDDAPSPVVVTLAPSSEPASAPLAPPAPDAAPVIVAEIVTEEVSAAVPSVAAAPPADEGPRFIIEPLSSETAPSAESVAAPAFVVTPPTQIAPPWEPPEQPVTSPLAGGETAVLTSVTAPLETARTSDLLTEPIPPPDFLAGMVSAPAAEAPAVETDVPASEAYVAAPAPSSATGSVAAPVFEITPEEEPPVRGTDLLPDELLAIRRQREAEARVETVVEPSPEPPPQAPAFAFEVAETPDETAVAPAMEASAVGVPPPPVAEETAVVAAAPPPEEVPPAPSFTPTFAPAALEAAPFTPSPVVETAVMEAPEAAPPAPPDEAPAMAGPVTLVDESVRFPAQGPATLVDESVTVAEVSAAVAPTPTIPPTESAASPASETPFLAATEKPAHEAVHEAVVETPVEAQVGAATAEAAPPPAVVDWSSFTLPPAVVDDIVRRVIAEMSERVVREIAWEVVPDLAELLIKKHLAQGNGRRADA